MLATPLRRKGSDASVASGQQGERSSSLRSERSIRPRRALPGGRAVTGGLLVALAAIGVFVVLSQAGRAPSTEYLVARRDLAVGHSLVAADLRRVALNLPAEQAASLVRADAATVGRVVRSPISGGALLSAGDTGASGTILATVTVALARSDAHGGEISAGDRVDVYVSYGTGTASSTRRIGNSVEVVRLSAGLGTVGESGRVEVTLAVPDGLRRIDLINAAHAGTVTLARVTGQPNPAPTDEETDAADIFAEQTLNNETAEDPANSSAPPTTTKKGS